MGNAFRKLFNLYPGEGKKLWLFVVLIFLWSVGGYGALTLSEGMFLEHIGASSLPKAYFALAGGLCLLSLLLLYALNRLSIPRLLITMILSAIGAYAGAYFLLTTTASADHTWFWYLFRMLGSVVPISTLVCFWSFVDQYYDLQDGKRLFCLFNAVTFLGDSVGGGIISFGYESLQPAGLLIIFLAAMGASLPFIYLITRKIDRVPEEHEEHHPRHASSFSQLLRTIFASRFTLILMGVYFVLQLVAIVTEFNYLGSLERNLASTKSKNITEFLGTCAAWVSLGNVVFGVLFYSRLVKKLGVNNIILIAPLFSLAIFFFWNFQDGLFFAILGIAAREGMVYSFEDNNLNLLISGVPSKIKNQVRISIDSFFEPAGMLISGSLLLLLQNESRLLGLVLSCVALAVVLFLRSHYPKAIFRNLVENTIRFEKKASDFLTRFSKKEKKEIEFILFSMLKKADEKTQLLAYESLLKMGNPQYLPRILNQMNRLSLPGKLRVLELLSEAPFARESVVIDRLERWRRTHAHPSLKSAIHFYFAKHGLLNLEKIVYDLENEHLGLRGAAILTFKTFPLHKTSASLDLAEKKHQKLLSSMDESEICMGLQILGHEKKAQNIEILFDYLNHPLNGVRSCAAQALASVASPQSAEYASAILDNLCQSSDGDVRLQCLKALGEIGSASSIREMILASAQFRPSERKMIESIVIDMGRENAPLLLEIVKDIRLHDRSRLLAGKILGKLSPSMIKTHLFDLLRIEIERAYFYYYHLHTVQRQLRQQDLSILENALLTGYHSVVDFIIQLLGVANSLEDCEILSLTLRSKNRKNRAHALETLEKMCDAKLFSLLEPIIDERPPEEKIHAFLKSGRSPLSLSQLLDTLEQSASFVDQIVAITMKARFNSPRWKESLKKKMETHKVIFHNFAHELLETTP